MADAPALVSVVTVSHNRRQNVVELLTALRHQTYPLFEIIVIDNASSDGTPAVVRHDFPEVHLIETGANLGMVAYNLGFQAARGEYVLVMDDDGLPGSPEWISEIVSRFGADAQLGAVACTIRMRDTGRIAHDSPQFDPTSSRHGGYPCPAFNGTGAGLRTAALRACGYYPACFTISYLELWLCSRLLDTGWATRLYPEIEVWHSRPTGSSMPALSEMGLRNYYWYVWELYPWPLVLTETLHELASRLKMTLQGNLPPARYWDATRAAFVGVRRALERREPVSTNTIRQLRALRRQGNWHGLAAQIRPFRWTDIVGVGAQTDE